MAILELIPPGFTPRDKQVKALDFLERAVNLGYKDIVIEAPTGVGKSLCGITACMFAQAHVEGTGDKGGYILTHQKMLQDQYERSFSKELVSLKSSIEYPCALYKTCNVGALQSKGKGGKKGPCRCLKEGGCPYKAQKAMFCGAACGLTNYAYFFTEREHVKEVKKRRLLALDEAHLLEGQIIRQVDAKVTETMLEKWAKELDLPTFKNIDEFRAWILAEYVPTLESWMEIISGTCETEEQIKETFVLEQHIAKMKRFCALVEQDSKEWVYWEEKDRDGKRECIARPITAAPFFQDLVGKAGDVRVYMSAFPGVKKVFCRSLGLDPENVAWLKLGSSFPPENRPIYMTLVGSMGMRNKDKTTGPLLKVLTRIAKQHSADNGVIHCHSYALGTAIYNHLVDEGFGTRLLFPRKADEREAAVHTLEESAKSQKKYILISPSVTEGFDFAEDVCRWQIIAKCPYMSLGDAQVAAKKDRDPDWYAMATIMTIIQAAGRVCRSDTDKGSTYILDSDVLMLFDRYPEFFPKWFMKAVVWVKKS